MGKEDQIAVSERRILERAGRYAVRPPIFRRRWRWPRVQSRKEMFEAPDIRHSAQATSLLPIEGITKCWRIAYGFAYGSSTGFAVERSF
jgi:hypothetical protein